jgi:hypothetical protein
MYGKELYKLYPNGVRYEEKERKKRKKRKKKQEKEKNF